MFDPGSGAAPAWQAPVVHGEQSGSASWERLGQFGSTQFRFASEAQEAIGVIVSESEAHHPLAARENEFGNS